MVNNKMWCRQKCTVYVYANPCEKKNISCFRKSIESTLVDKCKKKKNKAILVAKKEHNAVTS